MSEVSCAGHQCHINYDIVSINHRPRKANVWAMCILDSNLMVKRSIGWVDGLCHGSHMVNKTLIQGSHKFLHSELHTLNLCYGKIIGETKLCMLFPIFSDNIKLLLFFTLILKSTTVTWTTGVKTPPVHRSFKQCHGFFSISILHILIPTDWSSGSTLCETTTNRRII